MVQATSPQLLFVISIPPTLEDQLIDWLLERDGSPGFSSTAISGHSADPSRLSTAEKVTGKQRRTQFQVQIEAAEQRDFTARLGDAFEGADVHYWVVPLLAAGSLAGAGKGSEPFFL